MIDLARIRADTPAAQQQTFLLSAGASLMPRPVVNAVSEYLELEARWGGYGAAAREARRLQGVRDSVARLIHAKPDEVALLESATAAWQMAFYSLSFKPGDVVLTCEAEYAANYVALLQRRARDGIEIQIVPSNADGEIDLQALETMLTPRVKLVSLTWIPTNGGLANPAAEVGRLTRAHGVPYLLDACQAVGQIEVDVQALGCDMLSATGRKFLRAPRGTGFLFVRRDFIPRLTPYVIEHHAAPWVTLDAYALREDATRYEAFEQSYCSQIGLGVAIDYAMDIGIDQIAQRNTQLAGRLRQGLARIPGVTNRDLGRNPSAIVTFTVESMQAKEVARLAELESIAIGASVPANTRIDAERRKLPDLVRASPHYFNTEDEIDTFLAFVQGLVRCAGWRSVL